jgi:hypothetical protein
MRWENAWAGRSLAWGAMGLRDDTTNGSLGSISSVAVLCKKLS